MAGRKHTCVLEERKWVVIFTAGMRLYLRGMFWSEKIVVMQTGIFRETLSSLDISPFSPGVTALGNGVFRR